MRRPVFVKPTWRLPQLLMPKCQAALLPYALFVVHGIGPVQDKVRPGGRCYLRDALRGAGHEPQSSNHGLNTSTRSACRHALKDQISTLSLDVSHSLLFFYIPKPLMLPDSGRGRLFGQAAGLVKRSVTPHRMEHHRQLAGHGYHSHTFASFTARCLVQTPLP